MSGLEKVSFSSDAPVRAAAPAEATVGEQTAIESDLPSAKLNAEFIQASASPVLVNQYEGTKVGQKQAKSGQNEWTIALDLTTDYTSNLGVQSRLAEMRELALQTKNTPVTIIVQAAVPRSGQNNDASQAHLSTRREGARLVADTVDSSKDYDIERYAVAGGQMTKLEVVPSHGYAQDLQDLVGFTSAYPSKRLGLIVDSHGKGNPGLKGNTGSINMSQFTQAVSNGLTETRHGKLNFLDFDSCLMGQQGVLDTIKGISTDIVASSEIEENEGQNAIPALARLLNDPRMSGGMLADEFVLMQSDPNSKTHAIHTLAHYDMSHYTAWRASLNSFGDQLSELAKDPRNKSVLEGIIRNTDMYDPFDAFFGADFSIDPKFDLKSFVDGVVQATKKGDLKDPDASNLMSSARSILDQGHRFIKSYYSDKYYTDCGGMSVALPTSWMVHPELTSTVADRLARSAQRLEDPSIKPSTRSSDLADIDSTIKIVEKAETTNPDLTDSLRAVQDADKNLHAAASDQDLLQAAKQLQAAANVMQGTSYAIDEKRKQEEVNKAATASYFRGESITDLDGWGRFRYQMIPQSERSEAGR